MPPIDAIRKFLGTIVRFKIFSLSSIQVTSGTAIHRVIIHQLFEQLSSGK